ncbi:alkaline phosphatase family protein [Vallitalea pronyensis]|uniref:Alkaline phosphatase family protein n=1 Tax=Vallitalea pronyensis TaxID=1348613 RepID=A0A8J8MHZ9_9FIRM|nr:ectonucleotide pyrophosphatase/phosphodiesterase [Vallitalea pronyensis]QUI22005.1 alkaline phosphatase family protein [Vallitalea pronyensis]
MNKSLNPYLIVISIDALNALDFDYIKTLPTFKTFFDEGSYVRQLMSIYPSLTYPCHTTMITGMYPNRHGIVSNKIAQPSRYLHESWYWYYNYIKAPTLFDYAMKGGYTCGAIMWPAMAGAPITYNLPEIWPVKLENFIKVYLKNSTKNLFCSILKNFKPHLKIQPGVDNFSDNIANELIIRKQPHLLCIHFTELDLTRHQLGLYNDKNKAILRTMDGRLAKIIASTKQAGIYDKTTFMVLGDHGTSNYNNYICLNGLFKRKGWIKTNPNKKIIFWKAFANACGGSAHIYARPQNDTTFLSKVYQTLTGLCADPRNGIKCVYTNGETNDLYGLNNDFQFVLEAADGYAFRNNICNSLVVPISHFKRSNVADHGFLPSHQTMRTMLLAKGRGICSNIMIPRASLINIAPTIAKLLHLPMKNMAGTSLNKLLT